jgi:hypothetical protein
VTREAEAGAVSVRSDFTASGYRRILLALYFDPPFGYVMGVLGLAAAAVLLYAPGDTRTAGTGLLALLGLWIVLGVWVVAMKPRSAGAAASLHPYEVTLSDEGVAIHSEISDGFNAWDVYYRWRVADGYYLLYINDAAFLPIDRRAVPVERVGDLEDMLRRHIAAGRRGGRRRHKRG